jgi:hypothetical protein
VALIRERIIPTEGPPLVGESSANFLQIQGVAWSTRWIPTAVISGFLKAVLVSYSYKKTEKNSVVTNSTKELIFVDGGSKFINIHEETSSDESKIKENGRRRQSKPGGACPQCRGSYISRSHVSRLPNYCPTSITLHTLCEYFNAANSHTPSSQPTRLTANFLLRLFRGDTLCHRGGETLPMRQIFTDRWVDYVAVGHRQHSKYWFRILLGPMVIFMFFPRILHDFKWCFLFD